MKGDDREEARMERAGEKITGKRKVEGMRMRQ